MFMVNTEEKRLIRIERNLFNDLGLQERSDLQEWIVRSPEALNEDLLIIQKEFDGFEGTKERLDLLALDKNGRLVVIENKLDDSGRDVVWQALKYVAYCSNLKKAQIVKIYQKYLDRTHPNQNATENICEFLEIEGLEDTVLNAGNEQRLILVAANFRKEVTATLLWLIGHGVKAQCIRVSPYRLGDNLLIDFRQIIPAPEAADYMIGLMSKESEQRTEQSTQNQRREMRRAFWTKTLKELRDRCVTLYANVSPSRDHWLSAGSTGISGCSYNLIFAKREARVELNLARAETNENKWLFDQLIQKKEVIEESFNAELKWLRLDSKISSRIQYSKSFEGYNKDLWPKRIEWLCEHIVRLEKALSQPLRNLHGQLRAKLSEVDDAEIDSM